MLDLIARTRRELDQQGAAERQREQQGTPVMGRVTFGRTATSELKSALRGGQR